MSIPVTILVPPMRAAFVNVFHPGHMVQGREGNTKDFYGIALPSSLVRQAGIDTTNLHQLTPVGFSEPLVRISMAEHTEVFADASAQFSGFEPDDASVLWLSVTKKTADLRNITMDRVLQETGFRLDVERVEWRTDGGAGIRLSISGRRRIEVLPEAVTKRILEARRRDGMK
jgi:hypothetical protein